MRQFSDEVEVEDLELSNGTVVAVSFERSWNESVDPNYGADADGNRGVRMEFIEDDTAENIWVNCSQNGLVEKRWRPLKDFREANQSRIEGAVETWMDNNTPEGE